MLPVVLFFFLQLNLIIALWHGVYCICIEVGVFHPGCGLFRKVRRQQSHTKTSAPARSPEIGHPEPDPSELEHCSIESDPAAGSEPKLMCALCCEHLFIYLSIYLSVYLLSTDMNWRSTSWAECVLDVRTDEQKEEIKAGFDTQNILY